jgi:hypothetical protein
MVQTQCSSEVERLPQTLTWILLVAVGIALSAGPLVRKGYSPDEEITMLTARGISAGWLPLLPSGVVNSRGIGYSYLAWASGWLFGQNLPSYRLPSLLAGAATVLSTAILAERLGASFMVGGLLCLTATMLAVASTWARFYALFVVFYLATCLTLLGAQRARVERGTWFLVGFAATRMCHEMAVTLLALPVFFALAAPRGSTDRRRYGLLLLKSVLLAGALELGLAHMPSPVTQEAASVLDRNAGAPALLPSLAVAPTWATAVVVVGALALGVLLRRLGTPALATAICVGCVGSLNLGLLAFGLAGLLLLGGSGRGLVLAGVLSTVASPVLWSVPVMALSHERPALAVVASLAQTSFAFPMTGLHQFVETWPLTAVAAGLGLLAGVGRVEARACGFLVLSGLLLNGFVALPSEPRYFFHVLPLALALAAVLPAALGRLLASEVRRTAQALMTLTLLLMLTWDQEVGAADSAILVRRAGRPFSELRTADFESWTGVLRALPPHERVICNDDMACVLAGRRPDYWWLRSDVEARLYGTRPGISGRTSIYTGTPILVGTEALSVLERGERRRVWVVLLDTTKYGFLVLASSVPRSADLKIQAVCEGAGIRVLQLSPSMRPEAGRRTEEVEPCPAG